tara:strand:+ start:1700 stop:2020 length:321 start_codon:yes stop_codon:yes gene_type:complete
MIYAVGSACYESHVSSRHAPVVAGVGRDLWRAKASRSGELEFAPDPSSSGTMPAPSPSPCALIAQACLEARNRLALMGFDNVDERFLTPYRDPPAIFLAAQLELPR